MRFLLPASLCVIILVASRMAQGQPNGDPYSMMPDYSSIDTAGTPYSPASPYGQPSSYAEPVPYPSYAEPVPYQPDSQPMPYQSYPPPAPYHSMTSYSEPGDAYAPPPSYPSDTANPLPPPPPSTTSSDGQLPAESNLDHADEVLDEDVNALDLMTSDEWLHLTPPTLETWDGGIELGLNGTSGNSETFNVRAGADLERKTEFYTWEIEFQYAKTSTDEITTQHNAMLETKYERLFESPWTWFVRSGVQYDEFQAYDYRLYTNTGFGYRFFDDEITKLTARAGAGVSREFGGPNDELTPEALFGADFERRISKRQKLKAVFDYFPDWRDFTDYRTVTDVGWELLLDEESNLSLKLSLIDRYDSTPQGRKPNDLYYAILLLWNL